MRTEKCTEMDRQIDYVVPMVFHDDQLWQDDFKKVSLRYENCNLCELVRWRSWDTEELLIRCVRKFMPFVRTIYIILARESQRKPWMDADGISVVYHKDFIPEKFLPTFNSCTIEMFLHRIPGLSDRFIYGNDDMFPLGPLTEQDFFDGDVPCLHHREIPYPPNPNIFHQLCRSGQQFIASEFGINKEDVLIRGGHSLTPMLKSTWEYLWSRGAWQIEISITPMRNGRNFCQWICPWWHYLSGNYIDRVPEKIYVSTKNSVEDVVSAIRKSKGIVCINDNECEMDWMKYGRAVKKAIEDKLKLS